MSDEPLRILFVEDLPTDVEIAKRELARGGLTVLSQRVDTAKDLLESLASFRPDIVLSDYSMPAYDGMSALLAVQEFDPFLPVIMLTGSTNEDTAVACIKAGASRLRHKGAHSPAPLRRPRSPAAKRTAKEIREQEDLLRQSEDRYRSIFSESAR